MGSTKVLHHNIGPGQWYPHGATVFEGGVNFSIACGYAISVKLLLFERADSMEPREIILLDPERNRTFFFWHVFVEGAGAGTHYAWRVNGPGDTSSTGLRFDGKKVLLDPRSQAVNNGLWIRERACGQEDNGPFSMRSVIPIDTDYDWEGDRPLGNSSHNMIVYEMHVRGFTRHPSSGVASPGTFTGIVEKIPYLKSLGITHVELMPVMAFDEQDVAHEVSILGLTNYWGYSTHSFFSPHPGFCATPEEGTHRREFRDMVKALHRADIGVILDVVLNHTAEGGKGGPTINFKGLGNNVAYHLDRKDRRRYRDYTGCGNTVNCNHPLMCKLLLDCLEYWVKEMHVDGFRFDLASVFIRDQNGNPMENAPAVWGIELSDPLVNTHVIAEAWDAAGLYQVGRFPGFRWKEWNGKYRDVMRRFVRGDGGMVGDAATRISGSSDLYERGGRSPTNSINFVTCHDGFTLLDLVSYNEKHNHANGHSNGDGMDDNLAWNCGVEGVTDDPSIISLRIRQAKNFMAILFLSRGIPMILAGDEMLRTQRGNNNCYCQDNELSWIDWSLAEKNRDMVRFVSELAAFRKRHPSLTRQRFFTGKKTRDGRFPDVMWHGKELGKPLWTDQKARILAFTAGAAEDNGEDLHVILNMSDELVVMPLPKAPGLQWYRAVDTSLSSPGDIVIPSDQRALKASTFRVKPRSVVVFEGRLALLPRRKRRLRR